jgi:lysyl-tRNA synthetase class I
MRKLTIVLIIILILTATVFITRYSIAAEPQLQNDFSTSQVLINEIRELRRTLQDYTIANTRVQIAIERVKAQQMRVDHLSNEKENLQSQIEEAATSHQQAEEVAKSFDQQIVTESDPITRINIEREQKNMTHILEQYKRREQRLREREAQLAAQLQIERTALGELHNNLEGLEKAFDSKSSQRK